MEHCKNCRYASMEHMLDLLNFTLEDLGCGEAIRQCSDIELLEITTQKLRMLYNITVKAGVNEAILREAMKG